MLDLVRVGIPESFKVGWYPLLVQPVSKLSISGSRETSRARERRRDGERRIFLWLAWRACRQATSHINETLPQVQSQGL